MDADNHFHSVYRLARNLCQDRRDALLPACDSREAAGPPAKPAAAEKVKTGEASGLTLCLTSTSCGPSVPDDAVGRRRVNRTAGSEKAPGRVEFYLKRPADGGRALVPNSKRLKETSSSFGGSDFIGFSKSREDIAAPAFNANSQEKRNRKPWLSKLYRPSLVENKEILK